MHGGIIALSAAGISVYIYVGRDNRRISAHNFSVVYIVLRECEDASMGISEVGRLMHVLKMSERNVGPIAADIRMCKESLICAWPLHVAWDSS